MVIYLQHDTHGTKVAMDEAEAKYDESHGWSRFTPGQVEAPAEPAPVAVEQSVRSEPEPVAAIQSDGDEPEATAAVVDGAVDASPKEDEPEKKEPTIEELRALYLERFGKKAHHKKSAEALKKELGL